MNGSLLVAACALVYASVWRRRARQASEADITSYTFAQWSSLIRPTNPDGTPRRLADGETALSGWVVEGRTPPDPSKRWYWWVAATCSHCSDAETGHIEVHDAESGWESTRREAVRRRNAFAGWFMEDAESCPVLAQLLAEHMAAQHDDDEDGDEPSPA